MVKYENDSARLDVISNQHRCKDFSSLKQGEVWGEAAVGNWVLSSVRWLGWGVFIRFASRYGHKTSTAPVCILLVPNHLNFASANQTNTWRWGKQTYNSPNAEMVHQIAERQANSLEFRSCVLLLGWCMYITSRLLQTMSKISENW